MQRLREIATRHEVADDEITYLLRRAELAGNDGLTPSGDALFRLAWVLGDVPTAERVLAEAMRVLVPLQVVEQELRGLGAVPDQGVLDLLLQHRAIPPSTTLPEIRPLLRWLNANRRVAYSTKMNTVRSLAPAPDAPLAGEVPSLTAMVSPKTPYMNLVRLRRVLRSMREIVWWADPHFGARALEELAEELDPEVVRELRVLSGDAENVVSAKSLGDFKRLRAEFSNKGISAEWRVDVRGVRDWHDRWIADNSNAWNVPPVNSLFKGDYAEMLPVAARPPLELWWTRSALRN